MLSDVIKKNEIKVDRHIFKTWLILKFITFYAYYVYKN